MKTLLKETHEKTSYKLKERKEENEKEILKKFKNKSDT